MRAPLLLLKVSFHGRPELVINALVFLGAALSGRIFRKFYEEKNLCEVAVYLYDHPIHVYS